MVQRLASGWTVAAVTEAQGASAETVRKWRDRHAADGEAGLTDLCSRTLPSLRQFAAPIEAEIVAIRHERLSSLAIARRVGRPASTISAVLRRQLGRLSVLIPRLPVMRYERDPSAVSPRY